MPAGRDHSPTVKVSVQNILNLQLLDELKELFYCAEPSVNSYFLGLSIAGEVYRPGPH